MYLELESVFNREGECVNFDYSFDIGDESITTPVKVCGSVSNKTGIVSLSADAEFDFSTSCALCNKPVVRRTSVPVKHILVPHTENDDTDMYIVVDSMRLNLDELVSEDVYLAWPSRVLCKADCKGLCSVCGADLNEGVCKCKKETDPRWNALKDLFNE